LSPLYVLEVRCLHCQRCASRQRLPPWGSSRFLHSGVTYSRRFCTYLRRPPRRILYGLLTASLHNGACSHLTTPASSGSVYLSTAAGPGESGLRRCREGAARGSIAQPLSSPPAHSRDPHDIHQFGGGLWRLISTSPADLFGLSQRVERKAPATAQNLHTRPHRVGRCLEAFCLDRRGPVACAN
jgi:hypothetical protein